ncbi:MAG: glutamine-hydrolyzing GMP synthase [bacterium]|nr:glutamine-hydrolyzing GMP synthase [bacterium]
MILIVDNGSQYTHLIKRNMRDLGKTGEIVQNKKTTLMEVAEKNPDAIILSGGPSSVTAGENYVSEQIVNWIWKGDENWANTPLLGLCWGHQVIAHTLGGNVAKGKSAEYGISKIIVDNEDLLFREIPKEFTAWVSHFDEVKELPEGFVPLAHSETCEIEAMRHKERKIFGCQFHPEVWHTA